MKYIPGLDTMRAIAVATVITHHWFPGFLPGYHLERLGVDIFFYLSGFLITKILVTNLHMPAGVMLKNFYARRSLRIFPLYYLVIAVLIIAGVIGREWPWYATYTANHYFFHHGWQPLTSHLWTLSVEEQFYIIWPVLIILSRKWLPILFIVAAAGSIITTMMLTTGDSMVHVLTVNNIYKFALGGLMAYYLKDILTMPRHIGLSLLVVPLMAYILFPSYDLILLPFICLCCLHIGLTGYTNFGPTNYIGRISYGLYIYHNFIPYFVAKFINHGPFFYPICLGVLLLVSVTSYHLFETQLLKLKKYFQYKKGSASRALVTRSA